eukprot:12692116-Alexandrium_andersonii.AAC.1
MACACVCVCACVAAASVAAAAFLGSGAGGPCTGGGATSSPTFALGRRPPAGFTLGLGGRGPSPPAPLRWGG